MAFEKKIWKDRIAEFINRRTLTKEDGTTEIVTVARNEGTISQEGDAFNAESMNDLEDRIENEFNALNSSLVNNQGCTLLNYWNYNANSFRVHGNTCHFNFDIINGLNPAPNGTQFGKDAPLPKNFSRFPCIIISADGSTYSLACLGILANGDIKVFGGSVEFQGTVVCSGSYEIA